MFAVLLSDLVFAYFCAVIKSYELKKERCCGVKRGDPGKDRAAQSGSAEYRRLWAKIPPDWCHRAVSHPRSASEEWEMWAQIEPLQRAWLWWVWVSAELSGAERARECQAGRWGRAAGQQALTVLPVLEGRRKLFGSDPGDPRFLLGFLRRRHSRLRLGPGVRGPARQPERHQGPSLCKPRLGEPPDYLYEMPLLQAFLAVREELPLGVGIPWGRGGAASTASSQAASQAANHPGSLDIAAGCFASPEMDHPRAGC